MRILLMLFGAIVCLSGSVLCAVAEDISNMIAPMKLNATSSEANVWFEEALALDLGVSSSPNAIAAFAAMHRAADAGHEEAAFNVAAMLDSGRGVRRDAVQAAMWYARAAARGNQRAAFNLGLLYASGDGVPANADLSRAWYVESGLPAARENLARMKGTLKRPDRLQAPQPLSPQGRTVMPDLQQAELVWTSTLEPEPVRFFVELRIVDPKGSRESWSGFVDVSSVRLPLPHAAQILAWRVTAVASHSGDYAVSPWSVFGFTSTVN